MSPQHPSGNGHSLQKQFTRGRRIPHSAAEIRNFRVWLFALIRGAPPCVALFIRAMWAWHACAKWIATNYGVVGGAIAFAAMYAAACLMDR
jgi:hypothetical protein